MAGLTAAVRAYGAVDQRRSDEELAFYGSLSTEEAITAACMATRRDGKRCAHQRRIPRSVLEGARDRVVAEQGRILASQSFDDIIRIVAEATAGLQGFGVLSRYDTALRIGSHLGKLPDKVYLHAGARTGARNLGLEASREYLETKDLPRELQDLAPHDAENFLCLYKHDLQASGSCVSSVRHPGCGAPVPGRAKQRTKPGHDILDA